MDVLKLRPEGLYCPAGDFYVDPWRPVATAVITHAHADHARTGMGHYHTQTDNLALIRLRLGELPGSAYAYGERFRLGDATVSLHPAGHVLGSAQVRVEVEGQVWVVSGDYKRAPDPTCPPFEPVRCDTFITEATFALPCYRWAATEVLIDDVLAWWDACARAGHPAVLLGYAFGKAQRLLAELARHVPDRPAYIHGALTGLVEHYRNLGITMLPTLPVAEQPKARAYAGELILAPPSAAGSPWLTRFRGASLAFASGWMQLRGNRRRQSYDRGFAISDHADWPALVQTIRESGARRILATHGNTEALVRYLNDSGGGTVHAEALKTELGGEN